MIDIVCCGHDTTKINNMESLLASRNKGLTEQESQDKSLMGFYCESCGNWHKIMGGELMRYVDLDIDHHYDYYPLNGVQCFVFGDSE
jgi:hypothetical protein